MSRPRDTFVYVVDDDDDVRESTSELLKSAGIQARGAASARHFLAEYDSAAACVILDLQMPDLSGIHTLEILRGRGIQIPVVLFSGRCDLASENFARQSGARALLAKPFDHDVMIALVRDILGEAAAH